MIGLGRDERKVTSVVGLTQSSAVTVVVASTVAVVAFGIDTDAVADAEEDILDVDDDLTSLLLWVVPASRR